ncbi:MAG: Na+/H+ antiporter subunit D, partial [Bacilli bacterium]|nr:Na+/H+ antiporter subunit D [Bacilli bacterium]
MNNFIVLPMVIPLVTAIVLVFLRENVRIMRTITVISLLLNIGISIFILHHVLHHGIIRLDFGNWLPPFGILFVADTFAMLLVATTNIVSLIILYYSFFSIGIKREKLYFYTFAHFLIAGVNGSFLTGDIFNLFVTFEVMLIAS